jgi:hypothetical protein
VSRFFYRVKPIVIPQAASPGLGHMLSRGIPNAYSSTQKLFLLIFKVGITNFFCLSVGSVNKERGSRFRLGEVESSFKEFLASNERIGFQVLKIFLLLS